ncbi:MAG: hypothetical protein AB8F65_03695 [Woeseiaceae bacterium]
MTNDSYNFGDRLGDQCLALTANFLPNAQSAKLKASFQLRDAVLGAASTSAEASVCLTQLAWWQDELKRMVDGHARHPASKNFALHCGHGTSTEPLTAEWIVLARRLIQNAAVSDADDFAIQAFRAYGVAIRLATGLDETATSESVRAGLLLAICNDWQNAISETDIIESVAHFAGDNSLQASAQPSLDRLNDLLTRVLNRVTQQNKPPSALYLLWNAWKSARRHS